MMKPSRRWPRAGGPVELSFTKDSIKDATRELGIDPGRIRKWKQRHQKNDQIQPVIDTLSDEQQQIRRLQRELREAQMERIAEATRYIKEGNHRTAERHLLQDRQKLFRFIKEHAHLFPTVCRCG